LVQSERRGLEPVRRSRLYESIVEQLQTFIDEGKLRPGDQLPPERVLAETFKVSRTSVREALRALEMIGLIEGRQGGGTFVRAPSSSELVQPFASALVAGKRELADIMDVREMIEPVIARRAAARVTDEQLAELRLILARQEEKARRGESFPDDDTLFHHTIAIAVDNPIVLRLLGVIMDLLRESRAAYLQSGDRPLRSLESHRRILEALTKRDPEAAYEATLAHVSRVRNDLVEGEAPS
jgi:GntR family transcriptional repressor for pyruvate dehydrogenase complex